MTTDHNLSDLNALLDQLDDPDRVVVLTLLDMTTTLIGYYGNLPRDKSTWNDKYCLIYLLHNTMMALLRKEIRPLAFAMAEKLGHCEVSRQEKGNV
jgi:hypothetical protein